MFFGSLEERKMRMTTARNALANVGARRLRLFGLFAILLASSIAGVQVAGASYGHNNDNRTVLSFDTMAGVPQALTGTQAPIRGINGGGIPWIISDAKGELRANGDLKVEVKGLVLATTHSNPAAQFKYVVSCITVDQATNAVTAVNVSTGPVAASSRGDSRISTNVDLPDNCIAPIIFVTSPGGSWFAATGF